MISLLFAGTKISPVYWSDDVDASITGVSKRDMALLLPHWKARSIRNANYHDRA
ncbi:hypothetical protein [Mesorhizobium sp. LCM 4577]|uniref:hypothetical protein n=1 Tax=Mesorhizobium sp. LCM 4577 TaxID=1848288 RepID=UPI0012FFB5B9|nr:hypothetical protein [Mesorhizobium sp. LCM 4577]